MPKLLPSFRKRCSPGQKRISKKGTKPIACLWKKKKKKSTKKKAR